MQAKAGVETDKKDRERIIVSELPYQVNKAQLIEKIAELVRDKKMEGITDLRDESDRDGMRIVIEVSKNVERPGGSEQPAHSKPLFGHLSASSCWPWSTASRAS